MEKSTKHIAVFNVQIVLRCVKPKFQISGETGMVRDNLFSCLVSLVCSSPYSDPHTDIVGSGNAPSTIRRHTIINTKKKNFRRRGASCVKYCS